MSSTFYVYLLANTKGRRPVLYVGVTNDLVGRIAEHRTLKSGFTARYNVTTLVYVENHCDPIQAIVREKQIKGWRREKKVELVRSTNPSWRDLLPPTTQAPSSAPVFPAPRAASVEGARDGVVPSLRTLDAQVSRRNKGAS